MVSTVHNLFLYFHIPLNYIVRYHLLPTILLLHLILSLYSNHPRSDQNEVLYLLHSEQYFHYVYYLYIYLDISPFCLVLKNCPSDPNPFDLGFLDMNACFHLKENYDFLQIYYFSIYLPFQCPWEAWRDLSYIF